uniref:Uncharacterized protein n=1 Tax=Rhizophora mucronata TaxID=61149 RepID=A0A2P2PW08_RHIMU
MIVVKGISLHEALTLCGIEKDQINITLLLFSQKRSFSNSNL